MLRVLYDHVAFTRARYGGVARYASRLVEHVLDFPERVEVELFQGLYICEYDIRSRDRLARSLGYRMPIRKRVRRIIAPINQQLVRRFARSSSAQVMHLTSYVDFAQSFKGPRVVTLHDLISERLAHRFTPSIDHSYGQASIRASMKWADGIICISKNTQRDAVELLGVPIEKTCVIYHGVDLQPDPDAPAPIDRPYLLYVGMRGSYKNDIVLRDAWASDRSLHEKFDLVFFGAGLPGRPELESIPERLRSRVHFRAGSDRDLAGAYQNAAALVYPSHYEGFGLPLVEAMRCGCPVVASRASCLPEIGGDAALYFDPDSPDELRESLGRIVNDSSLRSRLIESGKTRAAGFTWHNTARQTIDFYQRVAGN